MCIRDSLQRILGRRACFTDPRKQSEIQNAEAQRQQDGHHGYNRTFFHLAAPLVSAYEKHDPFSQTAHLQYSLKIRFCLP